MKITVCIGSYCHVKGSRYIIERIHQLITEKNLMEKVELAGAFCMGQCQKKDDGCTEKNVSVRVDDALFSISPEETDAFFEKEVLAKL